MKARKRAPANPGPSGGYHFIAFLEKQLPSSIFNALLNTGTFVGLLVMRQQRRFSAEYLMSILGRQPSLREQYTHFRAFMTGLVMKLRAGRRVYPTLRFSEDAHREDFIELCRSPEQVLFGTFHVGYSDMMGCMLKDFNRRVSMIRLKVDNSLDTDLIEEIFRDSIRFIWINNPADFIFQLKEAIESGDSIGLQCDRTIFGSKFEGFNFLGCRRKFPFTIYHLSALFELPVVFSFTGRASSAGDIPVYTSPVFRPKADRRENLRLARAHFQDVLVKLEEHLRLYPELWFNFVPMNEQIDD